MWYDSPKISEIGTPIILPAAPHNSQIYSRHTSNVLLWIETKCMASMREVKLGYRHVEEERGQNHGCRAFLC